MKWQPGECHCGDMIRVKLGSIWHYGIFVSEEEVIAFGLPPVEAYRDAPNRETVCATDVDVFACGRILEASRLERAERKRSYSPDEIVRRARARLGETGYHLIHNNCEHFAYECVFGEKRSTQQEDALRRWKDRKICNIYLARITSRELPDDLYPPERRSEIQAVTHPGLRAAKLTDWQLLQYAARHCFSMNFHDLRFEKSKAGKWSCDQFAFSLSHTDSCVAVAVSNGPVGVDIEEPEAFSAAFSDEKIEALLSRYCSRAERSRFSSEPASFLTCWTRKEAAFKRRGKDTYHPKAYDALSKELYSFRVSDPVDLVLSVCGENAAQPHIYFFDGSSSHLLSPAVLTS